MSVPIVPPGFGDPRGPGASGAALHAASGPAALDAFDVLEAMPLPVLLLSWTGVPLFMNAAAERVFGRARAEVVGRAGGEVFPEEIDSAAGIAIGAAIAERRAMTVEAFVAPAGRWMEIEGRPAAGGLALFLKDLTGARAVDAALRETEAWVARVYDLSSDAMFLMDVEDEGVYRCRSVNASYTAVTGLGLRDVAGRLVEEILPEPACGYVRGRYAEAIAARAAIRYTEDVELPTGRVVVETTLTPVLDDVSGRCTHLLGAARDVTARVFAEQEQRRLAEQLQQAQKMEAMGRLAGGVAHDFNNLLTAIKCNCELLADDPSLGIEGRADVAEISRTADRAAALTRQLLAFSRKQTLQPRVFDLNGVIAEMDQMLRRLIVAEVALVTHTDAAPCRIRADVAQMEQVVMNLAVNARDAMPDGGGVTVETRHEAVPAPLRHRHGTLPAGRYVVLAVTDAGTGMDASTMAHLFEPFFTTKERGKGTGLGLSTVYGIVSQFGGHVAVSSRPGAGSTFSVYLPDADAAD